MRNYYDTINILPRLLRKQRRPLVFLAWKIQQKHNLLKQDIA